MENVDHQRANAAFTSVASRFAQGWTDQTQEGPHKYRSVTLSAGAMLRQVGLLQMLAFWLSKKEAEKSVLHDLVDWLTRSPITASICAASNNRLAVTAAEPLEAIRALVQRTSGELAVLESEARSYLAWHKRFTEGHWIAIEKPDAGKKQGEVSG